MQVRYIVTVIAGSLAFIGVMAFVGYRQSQKPTAIQPAPTPMIELFAPLDAIAIVCKGDRAAQVWAAYEDVKARTEIKEEITDEVFNASNRFPESCTGKSIKMGETRRIPKVKGEQYTTIVGNAPEGWVIVQQW